MRLTWNTAHTALTQDMRELMDRFNEATPLQLASQLQEVRQDLALEVRHRKQAVDVLSGLLQQIDPSTNFCLERRSGLSQSARAKSLTPNHRPSEQPIPNRMRPNFKLYNPDSYIISPGIS